MPEYRRRHVAGGTYFFTLVTAGRERFLCDRPARALLRRCLREARAARPFAMDAIVLLPDHLHTIWTLSPGDTGYSLRWSAIKGHFTRRWLLGDGARAERLVRRGQRRERRRGVWQPRFMEHTVRDEDDLATHLDCLHYNPVKHGLARCPKDWPHSSFHRFVRNRFYPPDWCCAAGGRPPKFTRIDADLLE